MSDEVLAEVRASEPRRWFGIVMLAFMGGLLLYVSFATPPAFEWQLFLIGVGIASLLLAERMRRSTAGVIELTATELRTADGETIATVADIERVERGMFAFKPSNGFVIRTRTRGSRRWEPGLWWRIGRRIGVGGVTPGRQTKFMSEVIAALMADRQAD